ncbi:MAG TPA: hypothetical protein VNF05_00880 [Acidimicrobiales bacterium]|nr:hypothetical protein [Acidimicrobiales bacterium]
MARSRVYLEEGKSSVFAISCDWPGWCRRAKTPDLAIQALDAYRERYAKIVTSAFRPGPFEIIGTTRGNATTDFGAPDARGPWDEDDLTPRELARQLAVLQDCWNYFDAVVANAPAELKKGPRGGGRDRDGVVNHVREAERAYCSKVGFRVAPRTPWDEQRDVVVTTLRAATRNEKWPVAYAIRRCAWHVVDHAWEIEDKGF